MDIKKIQTILHDKFNLNAASNVAVVGLGVTGFSIACFLSKLGIPFYLLDSREHPEAKNAFEQQFSAVTFYLGALSNEHFEQATHLMVSPGLSLNEFAIATSLKNNVPLVSDVDIFSMIVSVPIIAITGANGKSTVTTMLGDMATACGKKTVIGGNLGTPVLDLLSDDAALYVLELSSFQLERTSMLNATAATVLNISVDHLDRYQNLIEYAQAKQRIFAGNGVMVINMDDPIVCSMQHAHRTTIGFSVKGIADFYLAAFEDQEYLMHNTQPLMPVLDLPLEGKHNVANALAALALGFAVGLDDIKMCSALRHFQALQHRMQRVSTKKNITWVNDSKATNIGACIAALEGYDKKVILIAGGDGKGADMNELASVIHLKAKAVILIGKDALSIEAALNQLPDIIPAYHAESMDEVVAIAAHIAQAHDTVLLSPACASLDQYKNYQDRGLQFIQAIARLDV